jgi:hypothetical protein
MDYACAHPPGERSDSGQKNGACWFHGASFLSKSLQAFRQRAVMHRHGVAWSVAAVVQGR